MLVVRIRVSNVKEKKYQKKWNRKGRYILKDHIKLAFERGEGEVR